MRCNTGDSRAVRGLTPDFALRGDRTVLPSWSLEPGILDEDDRRRKVRRGT